jgi:hypothetical protein
MSFAVIEGDVTIRDSSGVELAIADAALLSSTKGLLVAGSDGTNARFLKVGADGTVAISAVALPLPAGAATEATLVSLEGKDFATQTTLAALLAAFNAEDFATETTQATLLTEAEFEARIGTLGQKTMAGSTPVVVASDQSDIDVILKDVNGLALDAAHAATIPAALRHLVAAGVDADDIVRRLLATSDGRLITSSVVSAPPGRTPVNFEVQSNVAGNGSADTTYLIPSGETLTIQRFAGGAQGDASGSGSKIELWYDPAGTGTGMTLVRTGYVRDGNFEFSLDNEYTGDGTALMRVRRTRFSGGALEMAAFFDGYY